MEKKRNERVFANVDDYEIATSTCRTEGVSEMETYGLKLLVRGQPVVEISDLDRNRDVVVGFGERLKQKTGGPGRDTVSGRRLFRRGIRPSFFIK